MNYHNAHVIRNYDDTKQDYWTETELFYTINDDSIVFQCDKIRAIITRDYKITFTLNTRFPANTVLDANIRFHWYYLNNGNIVSEFMLSQDRIIYPTIEPLYYSCNMNTANDENEINLLFSFREQYILFDDPFNVLGLNNYGEFNRLIDGKYVSETIDEIRDYMEEIDFDIRGIHLFNNQYLYEQSAEFRDHVDACLTIKIQNHLNYDWQSRYLDPYYKNDENLIAKGIKQGLIPKNPYTDGLLNECKETFKSDNMDTIAAEVYSQFREIVRDLGYVDAITAFMESFDKYFVSKYCLIKGCIRPNNLLI